MTTPDNGQPYFAISGELVADFIALARLVEARRPEIAAISGAYHLAIDATAGTVLLAKQLSSGDLVLVERILVNPDEPTRFGASELPMQPAQESMWH